MGAKDRYTGRLTVCVLGILGAVLFLLTPLVAGAQPFKGYDVNTEITLEGQVVDILPGNKLVLKVEDKTYRLILGPRWFSKKLGLRPRPGDRLQITGSKVFGKDGRIYILGRVVRWHQKKFYLRDETGRPLWGR